MARVLVLDVNKNEVREANCTELDDFYRELQAEPLDVVHYPVGNKRYDVFVDDEGLFRDVKIVSAINLFGRPILVGNLIFANHNEAGEPTDLSDFDIDNIKRYIRVVDDLDSEYHGRKVLVVNTWLSL